MIRVPCSAHVSIAAVIVLVTLGCGGKSELIDRDAGSDTDGIFDAMPDGPPRPECPPYQKKCNGECIPVSVDPMNCGDCGVTCAAGQVCSAGGCADSCLAALTECAGTCVDLKSDSNHCNSCDFKCASGKGCVDGNCVDAVSVGPEPAQCAGGGPPIVVGDPSDPTCLGGLVETTFRWAVCSCRDVSLDNPLLTDAYDSSSGPYQPGQLGGGLGVNGAFTNSSLSTIGGALWSSSTTGGVLTSNMTSIRQELHVGGPLTVGNPFVVDADAYVVGDVTTSSTVNINGNLYLGPGATVTGSVSYMMPALPGPTTVAPPCDCDPNQQIPVANLVAAHRATNNDNALIGLDPNVLMMPNAARRLDLPCGRYYLSGINTNAPTVIMATGRTALFIDGDVVTGSPLTFAVGPAGELDVFIADRLTTSAKMSIGSPNYPALTRLYLGGVGNSFTITNDVQFGGFLYLARGKFEASNPIEVFGGIIAGDFRNTGSTTIHYDRQVLEAGDYCPPAPPVCETCADCGNQACNAGTCGACSTSADCCSPLSCWEGECVLIIE